MEVKMSNNEEYYSDDRDYDVDDDDSDDDGVNNADDADDVYIYAISKRIYLGYQIPLRNQ